MNYTLVVSDSESYIRDSIYKSKERLLFLTFNTDVYLEIKSNFPKQSIEYGIGSFIVSEVYNDTVSIIDKINMFLTEQFRNCKIPKQVYEVGKHIESNTTISNIATALLIKSSLFFPEMSP